jgi:hypothetical protein
MCEAIPDIKHMMLPTPRHLAGVNFDKASSLSLSLADAY